VAVIIGGLEEVINGVEAGHFLRFLRMLRINADSERVRGNGAPIGAGDNVEGDFRTH
jgi:hypothetical protein